jgi:tetratricopeptide (TPR) repeat protein
MRLATLLLAAVTLSPAPALASPADRQSPKRAPAALARSSWGKVTGWIMDAASRRPIADALVTLEINGEFPASGRGTARSDATGRFTTQAPLGKISSNLDWGRVMTMHPFSLVFSPRAMMKETRIVDVAQVNARVAAAGYRPFLGAVRVADANADGFTLHLEDVWLAPERSRLASFSPDNVQHEMIEGFSISPSVCAPGEKVTVTLTARLPVDRRIRYRAYLISNNTRLMASDAPLKASPPVASEPNRVVFSKSLKVEATTAERYAELGFYLIRNGRTTLVEPETKLLLQSVRGPEERVAAQMLDEGYGLARRGELDAAAQRYAAARITAPTYTLAHLLYGDLCLRMGRSVAALEAFKKLVDLSPEDWDVARPRHILALLQTGDVDAAALEVKAAEQKSRRVPPQIDLYRARIAALQNRFEEADKCLARAGELVQVPSALQLEINLRRMQVAAASQPDSAPVRLAYARVLRGAGRFDEAAAQAERALRLAPGDAWACVDLATTLREAGRTGEWLPALRKSLELDPKNSEARLLLADWQRDSGRYAEALSTYRGLAEGEPNNLRARHGLALMLMQTGDYARARQELAEVVEHSRAKGETEDMGLMMPWQSIYFGPKRRLVSGFATPEGSADRVILEALDNLDRNAKNVLAWQNIGGALVQLSAPRLALEALDRAASLDPNLLDTRYYRALALARLGEVADARAELEGVIAANPLHPHARLQLAQLLTDQGQVDQAQAQILAHAKNYPDERR